MVWSRADRLSIFFTGVYARAASLATLVGSILLLTVLPNADFNSLRFYFSPVLLTQGRVTGTEATRVSEDDKPVQAITYEYQLAGQNWPGRSFSSTLQVQPGEEVIIEYLPTQPEYSRISGAAGAPISLWRLVFVGTMAGVGLWLVRKNIIRAKRVLALLEDAAVVRATREEMQKTSQEVHDRTVYKLRYSYLFGGQAYSHSFLTVHPTRFRDTETILLHRAVPANALLVKELPGSIQEKAAAQLWFSA